MVNVVVKGLPINMKYAQVVSLVRKHSEFGFAKQLHCKTISKTTKLIVLSMKSDDARKFRRALDGYVVEHNGDNYPLTCMVAKTNESEERRSRSSSVEIIEEESSPVTRYSLEPEISINDIVEDIKAIDLRIDIVRHQRILIEEEVNLILEQRKLLLKKNKLSNLKNDTEQPFQLAKPRNKGKVAKSQSFMAVLRLIVFELRELIKKHTNHQNRNVIKYMVRTSVKRRLIKCLQGKVLTYLTPEEFKNLYRMEYPKDTDEALVLKVVSEYRQRKRHKNMTESKVTPLMDPDEVYDLDMENDLDYWTEDLWKTEIKGEYGFSIKEEANDDVVFVEAPKVEPHIKVEEVDRIIKVEAHKEVKKEVDRVFKEIAVKSDEGVTIVDDNTVDGNVIIVD